MDTMTEPTYKEIGELEDLLETAKNNYDAYKARFDARAGEYWSEVIEGSEPERRMKSKNSDRELDELKARYNMYVDLSSREDGETEDGLKEIFQGSADAFDDTETTYIEVFSKANVLLDAAERVVGNNPAGGAIDGPENINELLTASMWGISGAVGIEVGKFLWKFKKRRDAFRLAAKLDDVADGLRGGGQGLRTLTNLAAARATGNVATSVKNIGKISKISGALSVVGIGIAGYAVYAKVQGDKALIAHLNSSIPGYEGWYVETFDKAETLHTVVQAMIDDINEMLTAYGASSVEDLLANVDYAIKSVGEYEGLLQAVDRMICAGKRAGDNLPNNDDIRKFTGLTTTFIGARRTAALLDSEYCDSLPEPSSD